ncbi:hypothetical protein [Parvularcula sp. IMCC14364]|uniref:hypothetical protein n=1 Tax=Parvularcula sp. IMCC14364 TaxID=3067902 RepID=UPI0027420293|nr:hypothetical protein [Parvularcula sp. IMCC14364]
MANNSMAQVLAESGVGNEDSMHQIRQIARIMNPTGSIDGEVPYSFSQILFEQADPACTSNCEIVPARDFIFSDRLDSRSCDVHVLSPGEKPDSILEIPSSIDGLAIIVIVVGHQVDYKPIFGARVIESLSDGAVNIKRYAYSVRHTGEAFSYPNNASAFYQDCS